MPKKDIFKDISRLTSSAFEALGNMKDDISKMINEQIKTSLKKMDFVTKAEHNALKKSIEEIKAHVGMLDKSKPAKKSKTTNKK